MGLRLRVFYLTNELPEPVGFVTKSYSYQWEGWLYASLPQGIANVVRERLVSNLKHILVGLEMKAALVVPHHLQEQGYSLLFEPYAQIMHFEFCVGTFSVCEGLGSAYHLVNNQLDGAAGQVVYFNEWKQALVNRFAQNDGGVFAALIDSVKATRDRLHQDRLGARANIDWHDFDYDLAFQPALAAIHTLLAFNAHQVPQASNLRP